MIKKITSNWLISVSLLFLSFMLIHPDILDLIQGFIPSRFIPGFVNEYINTGATLEVTFVWSMVALLCATYIIHWRNRKHYADLSTGLQAKIDAYEDHKPEYRIELSEVSTSKECSCHTYIIVIVNITPLNAWEGTLSGEPFIRCENPLIERSYFNNGWSRNIYEYHENDYSPRLEFPFSLSTNGTTQLKMTIKIALTDDDIRNQELPQAVPFLIELIYYYYSAELGYAVEDKETINFSVDLSNIEPYRLSRA